MGLESDFRGVVDLVANTVLLWENEDLGAKYRVYPIKDAPIDEELKKKAATARGGFLYINIDCFIDCHTLTASLSAKLLETIVEQDDEALMTYLEGGDLPIETIKRCIRKGTLTFSLTPVLAGSSFKNKVTHCLKLSPLHQSQCM